MHPMLVDILSHSVYLITCEIKDFTEFKISCTDYIPKQCLILECFKISDKGVKSRKHYTDVLRKFISFVQVIVFFSLIGFV